MSSSPSRVLRTLGTFRRDHAMIAKAMIPIGMLIQTAREGERDRVSGPRSRRGSGTNTHKPNARKSRWPLRLGERPV